MNKMRPLITVFLVLIVYIVLNDTIVNLLANTEAFLRHDNKAELIETNYQAKVEELEREITEYEKMKENFEIYEGESHVLAKAALRNIYDIYDYLIANTENKVSVGDLVLNEHGLVGTVSEATRSTAKIDLLTSNPKLSVKVGECYGILGEYDRESGEFLVHNIDNYKQVSLDDEVTTSGFQTIKSGIKIGKVTAVDTKGVEKIIRVKPYVDFKNLNYLLILAK